MKKKRYNKDSNKAKQKGEKKITWHKTKTQNETKTSIRNDQSGEATRIYKIHLKPMIKKWKKGIFRMRPQESRLENKTKQAKRMPRHEETRARTSKRTREEGKKAAVPPHTQRHLVSPNRRPRRRITLISGPQQEATAHYDHYSVRCSPPRPHQVSEGRCR